MNYLDEVRRKRSLMAAHRVREREIERTEVATKDSGQTVAAEIARQFSRTRQAVQTVKVQNSDLAKRTDISEVVRAVDNLQKAVSASSTTSVADLAVYLRKIEAQMLAVAQSTSTISGDTTAADKLDAVAALLAETNKLTVAERKAAATRTKDITTALAGLMDAFEGLHTTVAGKDYNPKITVSPAKVDVPALDITPITEAIQAMATTPDDSIDLDDYQAQDLRDDGPYQYVGFVAPDGGWYIIFSDSSDSGASSLRYKFGNNGYAKAWKNAVGFDYKLLNEAVNEVSA
jgi:uncharacterized membrane protein